MLTPEPVAVALPPLWVKLPDVTCQLVVVKPPLPLKLSVNGNPRAVLVSV